MSNILVEDVNVFRMLCGQIICSHCGNKQSAQAWHHEQDQVPLKKYAVRCINCGNPLPSIKGDEK